MVEVCEEGIVARKPLPVLLFKVAFIIGRSIFTVFMYYLVAFLLIGTKFDLLNKLHTYTSNLH